MIPSATWQLLNDVNRRINRLPYRTDLALYGTPEFWTVMGDQGGDCEDYALRKRQDLIAAGLDAHQLLPAVGLTATGEGHCVLIYDVGDGAYVLDNCTDQILSWDDPACTIKQWIERASPDGTWVTLSRP